MKKNIIVAVDGPAGSGKSSVSKIVAVKKGLKYIDSGALYRTITYYVLDQVKKIEKNLDYKNILKDIEISQQFNSDGSASTYLNDLDVSDEIRNEVITKNIGIISDNIDVRNFITNLLRSWQGESPIIMDGRDIGTIVFPDAEIKIYLDASVDVRAERRYKEYLESGKKVDLNDIKNQIIQRDNQDKNRPLGALVQADDAIYLDSSNINKEAVIDKIVSIIDNKLDNN